MNARTSGIAASLAFPAGFDAGATLQGETMRLRRLGPVDFDALYAVANDPLLWAQHFNPRQHERTVFEGWFDLAIRTGALIAEDVRSGEVLGSSRFYTTSEEPGDIAIGATFIGRRWWGGAVNREMKRLMTDHVFAHRPHAVLHIAVDNARSRAAAAKIGARYLQTRTLTIFGTPLVRRCYTLTPDTIFHPVPKDIP